jgi:hypothetical protein
MVRQCAWCLCLINTWGERVSLSPLPKLYEATHGICGICGIQWMEQVLETDPTLQNRRGDDESCIFPDREQQESQEIRETIIQLMLQLQQKPPGAPPVPIQKQKKHTRTF